MRSAGVTRYQGTRLVSRRRPGAPSLAPPRIKCHPAPPPPPPPPPPRGPPRLAAFGDGGGGDGDNPPFLRRSTGGPPSLARLVALGVGLAAAALAAAPSILSTRPGTRLLCRLLARALGGRVAVSCDRVSLAWRRPPEVVGLVVTPKPDKQRRRKKTARDEDEGEGEGSAEPPAPVLSLGRASATASLSAIAFSRRRFDVVLSQPYIDLYLTPDGRTTRLDRALSGGGSGGREEEEEEEGAAAEAAALRDAEAFGPTAPDPPLDPSASLGPPMPQPFSAEVRAGRWGLYVSDGFARVPADAREVVTGGAAPAPKEGGGGGGGWLFGRGPPPPAPGPVHAVVLVGTEALEEDGEALGWDPAAWDDPGGDPRTAAAVVVGKDGFDAGWARAGRRPRGARAPLAVTLRAPGVRAQASGWIVGGGVWAASPAAAAAGLARGWLKRATRRGGHGKRGAALATPGGWGLCLRDPGLAVAAAVTPALARTGLARLSPLLSDAVAVQGAAAVRLAVAPAGLRLPAPSARISVAPLKLTLVATDGGGGKSGTSSRKGPASLAGRLLAWLGGLGAAAARGLPGGGRSGHGGGALTAWTAPAVVEVSPAGLSVPRFDVLLSAAGDTAAAAGGASKGVHLVTWGVVDPAGRRVGMTVGVPGKTLTGLGLAGIPPAALLPISVRGPLHRPRVDFVGASGRLAALVAAGAAEGGVSGGGAEGGGGALAALRRAVGKGVGRGVGALAGVGREGRGPPPPSSLPWEVGARLPTQIEDAKRRARVAEEQSWEE